MEYYILFLTSDLTIIYLLGRYALKCYLNIKTLNIQNNSIIMLSIKKQILRLVFRRFLFPQDYLYFTVLTIYIINIYMFKSTPFFILYPFIVNHNQTNNLTIYTNVPWEMQLFSPFKTLRTIMPQSSVSVGNQLFQSNLTHNQNTALQANKVISCQPKHKRIRNRQKELQSAKKNSQSNIIHQIFSFFLKYQQSSQKIVKKTILSLKKEQNQNEQIQILFYKVIRIIYLMKGKRYVNKEFFFNFYQPQTFIKQMPQIWNILSQTKLINIQELCLLIRITATFFIKNIGINAILTSKRITNVAKYEHLKRRRMISNSFDTTK